MRLVRKITGWLIAVAAVAGIVITWTALDMSAYRVDNGSMGDTLPVGSVVITYKTADLKPRDIITFQNDKGDGVVTHTFLGYADDGSLVTHGDANPSLDNHQPPLTMERVEGKVWRAVTPMSALVALVAVLLIVLICLIPAKPSEKNRQKEAPSAEESASTPV